MSAAEVNRMFKLIEDQYVTIGAIDPYDKAMLFEEMKGFDGADRFIQHISTVLNEILDEDEEDDGEVIVTELQQQILSPSSHARRCRKSRLLASMLFGRQIGPTAWVSHAQERPQIKAGGSKPPVAELQPSTDNERHEHSFPPDRCLRPSFHTLPQLNQLQNDWEPRRQPQPRTLRLLDLDGSTKSTSVEYSELLPDHSNMSNEDGTDLQPPATPPPTPSLEIFNDDCRKQQLLKLYPIEAFRNCFSDVSTSQISNSDVDFSEISRMQSQNDALYSRLPHLNSLDPKGLPIQPNQPPCDTDRKREKRKLKFNMVLEVFNLFRLSCNVENTTENDD